MLSMILVIGSLVLKVSSNLPSASSSLGTHTESQPVTLLATLGNLRQRGEPTFSLPSMPGSFNGLRGGGNSQTGQSSLLYPPHSSNKREQS